MVGHQTLWSGRVPGLYDTLNVTCVNHRNILNGILLFVFAIILPKLPSHYQFSLTSCINYLAYTSFGPKLKRSKFLLPQLNVSI